MAADFDRLFEPKAIALVGASADPDKLSGRPARYLEKFGYEGEVYLVNPGTDEIDGQPCYDSVMDLPAPVDVAFVLVPAQFTVEVIEDCGDADIPFAAVIASGFGEVGGEGEQLEADLRAAAERGGVRLIGPNAQGWVTVTDGVAATFSSICKRDEFIPGGVSVVSQSGAFGGAVFQVIQNRAIGASKWITTGNEADVDTVELLEYLVEEPDTDVVAAYVESLDEGRRLLEVGRRSVETETPIVAVRVGASQQGRTATESHTGSVASDDAIYSTMFDRAGLTRTRTVDEFADAVAAFATLDHARYSEPTGGLGVVSVSGGAAALIADTCARLDLPLADLAASTVADIRDEIPTYGSATNPVDVTGSVMGRPELFERCVEAVGLDPGVDGVLFQFGNSGPETIDACEAPIAALAEQHDLPVATVFTGAEPGPETVERLEARGVLTFADPARALAVLSHLRNRAAFRAQADSWRPDRYALPTTREPFTPETWDDLVALLASYEIATPASEVIASADAAAAFADAVEGPVVMKLDPVAVAHKSDRGGVETGLDSPGEVRAAYDRLVGLDADAGVVCQATVEGVELIAGVVNDSDFGPVCVFGPGGVFVELFDDAFAYRPVPVSEDEARAMVAESAASRLVDGYRDFPAVDEAALAETIANVSRLYAAVDLAELEFNPLIGTADGVVAVDALVE